MGPMVSQHPGEFLYPSVAKGHSSQLEETLTGQSWDNLNIKIDNDSNKL